jgi:hypothetical protein
MSDQRPSLTPGEVAFCIAMTALGFAAAAAAPALLVPYGIAVVAWAAYRFTRTKPGGS